MSKFDLMNGDKIVKNNKFKVGYVALRHPESRPGPCVINIATSEVLLSFSIESARERANELNVNDESWSKIITYFRPDYVLEELNEM